MLSQLHPPFFIYLPYAFKKTIDYSYFFVLYNYCQWFLYPFFYRLLVIGLSVVGKERRGEGISQPPLERGLKKVAPLQKGS
jgi:hypothetical protein